MRVAVFFYILSHSLFVLKESQEFVFDRYGYTAFMVMFYLNSLMNGGLWIYSNAVLIIDNCQTTAPDLSFWLTIEVLYGYVEIFIYLIMFVIAQFCGNRLIKG